MQANESANEMAQLRQEVATLREELNALKRVLGISAEQLLSEPQTPLSLRCKSVEIVTEDDCRVLELVAGEQGGEVRLYGDATKNQTSPAHSSPPVRAALQVTSEGASLALCGHDAVPRVVLQSRQEGGGVSLLNAEADLGAEMWGASEASWLALLSDGRPAVVSVATAESGNLQIFDAQDTIIAALPPDTTPLYSPE
jgi:hypothetical protein